MFFFWYCHKRGREVRIERENSPVDSNGRIIEIVNTEEPSNRSSGRSSPRRGHSDDPRDRHDGESDDEAAMERRKARRSAHEREKEEKRRVERRDDRDYDDLVTHHSSRPSSSQHGRSYKLKAGDRDRHGRRSRSSRES